MKIRMIVVFVAAAFVLAASVGGGFDQAKVNPNQQIQKNLGTLKPSLYIQITGVRCDHHGSPSPEVDLFGQHFGAPQGSRRVLVDGVPATSYVTWSDTTITIFAPSGSPTKWYHEYVFAIDDGAGKRLSNEFKIRFLIDWDGVSPGQGTPGTVLTLYSWGPGASQGTKVLHMDNTVMQVTGWSGTGSAIQIKAIVPAIAAGPHKIFFMDGADKISKELSFTVL